MSNQVGAFRCRQESNGHQQSKQPLPSPPMDGTLTEADFGSSKSNSLAKIVQIFQLFGISFGGLDLRGGALRLGPVSWCSGFVWVWWSAVLLCGLYTILIAFMYLSESTYTQFMQEMSHTKPILNYLTNSVIYLFAANNTLAILYLSFYGGRALVVHLADRTILDRDRDRRYANSVLLFIMAYIATVSITGIATNVYIRTKNHPNEPWFPYYISTQVIRVVVYYFSLSGILCLLVMILYVVHIYSEQIKTLRHVSPAVGLNLSQLIQIKRTISRLEGHFDQTTKLLQQLVLLNVIVGTWTLIGSLCMLLIIPSLSTFRFTSFVLLLFTNWILVFGVFIFYGNRVHQEYQQLLHHIRNRVQVWNIQNLLYFQRMSSTSTSQFQLRLYRTFSLNQTMLISLSTFILNYIVLLIQTDHSKSSDMNAIQNGTRHNSTDQW